MNYIIPQAKVYRRGDNIFAAWGNGFIRLLAGDGTTNPNVVWIDIEAEGVTLTRTGSPTLATVKAVA